MANNHVLNICLVVWYITDIDIKKSKRYYSKTVGTTKSVLSKINRAEKVLIF